MLFKISKKYLFHSRKLQKIFDITKNILFKLKLYFDLLILEPLTFLKK